MLRVGGRFVCISLLQEHIVTHLLSWFSQHSWMIRVCRWGLQQRCSLKGIEDGESSIGYVREVEGVYSERHAM